MQKYLYAHLEITPTAHMEYHYNSGRCNTELWKCIWQARLSVHYVVLRKT